MTTILRGRSRTFWLIFIAWTCAACLAALEAHFFLKGYRLNGDDVVFEYEIVHGEILDYIVRTASQQARVGFYVLLPLLLIGSHFSVYLWFRIIYVSLWYVDLLLFSIWFARLARTRIALPIFVGIVAMQSMIGVYMPPMGYPLELGVPLFVLLANRLFLAKRNFLAKELCAPVSVVLSLFLSIMYIVALVSSEYMMISGLFMVIAEIISRRPIDQLWKSRHWLVHYRSDILCICVVFFAYFIFRFEQTTHYQGTNLDGFNNYKNLFYVFAMHLFYGTWLPFFKLALLSSLTSFKPLLTSLLCGAALFIYWRAQIAGPALAAVNRRAVGVVLAVWIIAITLPVVAATSRQAPCLADGTCAYIDSRISLPLMVALLAIIGLSMVRSSRTKIIFQAFAFIALTFGSGISYVIARHQAGSTTVASEAWVRARDIACIRTAVNPGALAQHIDPGNQISILFNIDRKEYWTSYVDYLATHEHCPGAPIGVASAVRRNGTGEKYLVTGWSQPEPNGVWSDGSTALIGIHLSPSRLPLILDLALQAFPSGIRQSQIVSVEVDGAKAQKWEVMAGAATPYSVDVPESLSTSGGTLMVRLDIANPISPEQLGQSSDQRRLGVFLSELELKEK